MLKPDARGLYHLKHPEKVKGEDFVVIVPHWYVNILLRIGYTPFEEEDPADPPENPFNQLSEGESHEGHRD